MLHAIQDTSKYATIELYGYSRKTFRIISPYQNYETFLVPDRGGL